MQTCKCCGFEGPADSTDQYKIGIPAEFKSLCRLCVESGLAQLNETIPDKLEFKLTKSLIYAANMIRKDLEYLGQKIWELSNKNA